MKKESESGENGGILSSTFEWITDPTKELILTYLTSYGKIKIGKPIEHCLDICINTVLPRKTSKCDNFKIICAYNFFVVRRVAFYIFS